MTLGSKQHVAGGASLLSAIAMVFCIYRMIPYGISGEVDKAKFWFMIMIISLVIGLPFVIAFYYFRNRLRASGNFERLNTEISTLAFLSQQGMFAKGQVHSVVNHKKSKR